MFRAILNRFKPATRRSRRQPMAFGIETYEARTLLSATSAIAAEVSVEHVHHHHDHTAIQLASAANYDGHWQLSAGIALDLDQAGSSVTGTQSVLGVTAANFTGHVHGKKLIGELIAINVDAHSTIKVHLTDANHFAGKRHFFVNGASEGTQPFTGVRS